MGMLREGNRGDGNVKGGVGEKCSKQIVVDFATIMEMTVVNTYIKKREEHRLTYKSGGRGTHVVDNIM